MPELEASARALALEIDTLLSQLPLEIREIEDQLWNLKSKTAI